MIQADANFAPVGRQKRTTRRHQAQVTLTEADVLAMPHNDYMNDAQQFFFKTRLMALEVSLLAKTQDAHQAIATVGSAADPADRATAEEEHRLALVGRARDEARLLELRVALARIQSGDFGYCEETGDPIGVPRLLVQPTTVLTIEAQERRENLARRFRA